MLGNHKLQGMVNDMTQSGLGTLVQRNQTPLPDLSVLRSRRPEAVVSPEWAAKWLTESQAQWDLWNSLYCEHKPKYLPEIAGCARDVDEYIKFIEIDEKFSRMNFIQKSLRII